MAFDTPESAEPTGELRYVVPELPANYVVADELIEDHRIGELLVRHRVITHAQLVECRDEQVQNPDSLLSSILIMRGLVTPDEIEHVVELQLAELQLGQSLVKAGTITPEQLEHATQDQESSGELLGSILISAGYCSPEQLNAALAELEAVAE